MKTKTKKEIKNKHDWCSIVEDLADATFKRRVEGMIRLCSPEMIQLFNGEFSNKMLMIKHLLTPQVSHPIPYPPSANKSKAYKILLSLYEDVRLYKDGEGL